MIRHEPAATLPSVRPPCHSADRGAHGRYPAAAHSGKAVETARLRPPSRASLLAATVRRSLHPLLQRLGRRSREDLQGNSALRSENSLETVAAKLEAVLGDLDAIGQQRAAIDVCTALDRVRTQLDRIHDPPSPPD